MIGICDWVRGAEQLHGDFNIKHLAWLAHGNLEEVRLKSKENGPRAKAMMGLRHNPLVS